jgi:hypothetical protein
MKIFATSPCYVLGKELGPVEGLAEAQRQLQAPDRESLQCIRTLTRLATLADCQVRIDTGGTLIGKVRSEHFHDALNSDADAWVTVDDDVECTLETLDYLLGAVWDPIAPRVVTAPCLMRVGQERRADVQFPAVVQTREFPSLSGKSVKLGRATAMNFGGFGLVAMNRAAMRQFEKHWAWFTYVDHDVTRIAAFHEILDHDQAELEKGTGPVSSVPRRWYGEDFSFWLRCRMANIATEALVRGITFHAGHAMNLNDLDLQFDRERLEHGQYE